MAAESEVTFDSNLDGSDVRIGIIRTRWNEPDVKRLVGDDGGVRKALKECGVKESNIFETTVPGSFELPLAARFLALSGTVDAIVTAGVLIKGEVRTERQTDTQRERHTETDKGRDTHTQRERERAREVAFCFFVLFFVYCFLVWLSSSPYSSRLLFPP